MLVETRKKWLADNKDKVRAYQRKYQENNKELQKLRTRNSKLKKNFGITLERYNELVLQQDGKCAICKELETTVINGSLTSLAVDHDHTTGRVRGLLCCKCNRALGLMKDSVEILESAKEYLRGSK